MEDKLNSRAVALLAALLDVLLALVTFLKYGGPIHLQKGLVGVFVLLSVIHGALMVVFPIYS